MTRINTKPVKECQGCSLNLKKKCAVFEQPILQWKRGRCRGYNSPVYYALYYKMLHPEGSRRRKMQRVERAKLAHTVSHSDGVRPLKGRR